MKDFVTYSEFMRNAEAYLEIKLDLSDPVEIGDFAALFAGFGAEFERYLSEHHPDSAGTAKMYVSEVRKGSVIATMFADIPDMIGLADAALVALGFGALFSRRIRDFVQGKHLGGAKKSQLADVAKTVQALGNDKNGTMSVKGLRLRETEYETEFEAVFTEREARHALATISNQKQELDKVSTSDHHRVLMTFTRSDVGNAVVGKRSGERVVVQEISEKPKALVYGSDLAEAQIKDEIQNADENVYKRGFIVDLNLVFSGTRPVAYSVTKLHQVIDINE